MPRSPRIHFDGARHHVMNRAARRLMVFDKAEYVAYFEQLLSELPGRFGARVHAWALMGNHFHLLIDVPEGRLPALMAWLSAALARRVNDLNGWDGPLFRGRYRNRVVLDDAYWHDVLAYIHLNPVRAGMVDHPDDSGRTSHRFYSGQSAPPAWLTTHELLELYGGTIGYYEEIEQVLRGERTLDIMADATLLWAGPSTRGAALRPPAPAVSALEPVEALGQVARLTASAAEQLLVEGRGHVGNLPRTLAAWWLHRAAAQSRIQTGERLGMTASGVASAVHRVVHAGGELGAWRDRLLEERWAPLNREFREGGPDDVEN
ncbi:transposase [Deltaproteobacteria bacterium]|nr:transposase [Deltaproteobacteria bacterium]